MSTHTLREILEKTREIFKTNNREGYFIKHDNSTFLLVKKYISECNDIEEVLDVPLARFKITKTNYTFRSLLGLATSSDKEYMISRLKNVFSYCLIERQCNTIKDGVVQMGSEKLQQRENIKNIFSQMENTMFWSMLKVPTDAAMIIDLVMSDAFIDDLFDVFGGNPDIISNLQRLTKTIFDVETIKNVLYLVGCISFPQTIVTNRIELYNNIREYIRELFRCSDFLSRVVNEIKAETSTKKSRIEMINVREGSDPTLLQEINIKNVFELSEKKNIKMPMIEKKLSVYFILFYNSLHAMISKKESLAKSVLARVNIITSVDNPQLRVLTRDDVLHYCNLFHIETDDDLVEKLRDTWNVFFSKFLSKEKLLIDEIPPEAIAVLIYAMLSKEFWHHVVALFTTDQNFTATFSQKMEEFVKELNLSLDIDTTIDDIDENINTIKETLTTSMKSIKKMGRLITPYVQRSFPSLVSILEKMTSMDDNPFKVQYVKKVMYEFKRQSRKPV